MPVSSRIIELGGKCCFENKTLHENLESIVFQKSFLLKDFGDYMEAQMYEEIEVGKEFKESDIKYPRVTIKPTLFTPFKVGTKDYAEFNDLDKGLMKTTFGTEDPEFMIIGETEGFPNFYFVCLSDENIENPTVYSTDHETYFGDIENEGTLEDFFYQLASDEEFKHIMKELKTS
ncbi:hypothetical protein BB560_006756 [Smittium megazygosporum]|uniref:Uncharacterized protein n=1 Tax=Smittium megazygosporum TaxID=133381 RepID=A0A2T9Y1T9_9FUNG|nr:hypothetical protein BB560_006756 [Smittium megazygosporum]